MVPRHALLSLVVLAATSASAQISTDRPGLGFATPTVGPRVLQVEAGTPQATLFHSDAETFSVPVALRYGLTPAVEARLASSVYDSVFDGRVTDSGAGFSVLTVGVKVAVPVSGYSFAVIPEALVPTEGGADVGFQLNTPVSFAVGDVGVTLSPGIVTGNGSSGLNAVGAVSRAFGAVSAYAEIGAFPNLDHGGATPILAGGGVSTLLNADTQVDLFFDAGLNDDAPDLSVGVGFSFRFD